LALVDPANGQASTGKALKYAALRLGGGIGKRRLGWMADCRKRRRGGGNGRRWPCCIPKASSGRRKRATAAVPHPENVPTAAETGDGGRAVCRKRRPGGGNGNQRPARPSGVELQQHVLGNVARMNLEDRAAITDLIALHGHYVDTGQLDRLGELLAGDVTYDTIGLEQLRQAAIALGDRNPVGHHVTNTVVTDVDGDPDPRRCGLARDVPADHKGTTL
jgi:hypothetical protein